MVGAALLAGMVAAVVPLGAQTAQRPVRPLAEFSTAIEELAKASSPAVVQLTVRARAPLNEDGLRHAGFVAEREATGSGVIVSSDGYVLTNAHVVSGARHIDVSVMDRPARRLLDNHTHYSGKVVGLDKETDLALLKIEAKDLASLEFRDSRTLRQGQIVIALGSPLGLENTLTVGFVSAPVRHLNEDSPMFYVQTDAPINPGNSGGPLLDTDGRIAGINTMILTQSGGNEGIGLAIPANLAERVYRQLRKDGRIRRGQVGFIPQTITPALAKALDLPHHTGVILSDVLPDGPADDGGLLQGDVVTAIDKRPTRDARELRAALFHRPIGEEVAFDIQRGPERLTKTVTVLERPGFSGDLSELANQSGELVRDLGILALTVDGKVMRAVGELRRLYGVVVGAIPAEYAALNPGLVAGDVIYEFNRTQVKSVQELRAALGSKKSGDAIALLVERDNGLLYVSFELE